MKWIVTQLTKTVNSFFALDSARHWSDNTGMKTQTAIDHFGSREALAAALGIGRTATYWGESVPILRQYHLQVVTDGKLRAETTSDRKKVAA